MTPAFQGEIQFRRYSDTSTQGQQVVFAVSDREALANFIGKEGKRFMAVLVEIGDDELPVQPPVKPGPLCFEAIEYCKEDDFKQWVRHASGTDCRSRQYILDVCGVVSRKDLDTVATAGEKFRALIRIPFMKWQRERKA